jgi:AGCS family alanine or glycine:cation symporter
MSVIVNLLTIIDDFLWGPPMMILLIGTGIFLTIKVGFPQFLHLGYAWKITFKGAFKRDIAERGEGDITPFQALSSTLAATVGTGNIAGVATAVAAGGPGALVWMWITAIFGMATRMGEATLGVKYRIKDKDGAYAAGSMYFIEKGLGQKWLGWLFALFGSIAAFGMEMPDANSIALAGNSIFKIPVVVTGLVITFLTWIVIIGGIKRIGEVCELLSPFMTIFYMVGALIIIISKINLLPWAIGEIFKDAFTGRAALGGFAGATVAQAMRYGVARGIFSNEAGLGSGSIAHGVAQTKYPARQGSIGMVETMIDTLIICTMTGLVIVLTKSFETGLTSSALTAHAFGTVLGRLGGPIVTFTLFLFGYSSIITWCFYGQQCARYILGPAVVKPYAWLFVLAIFLGSVAKVTFVWLLADALNGAMAIPNLIGLLFLSGVLAKEVKGYFSNPELLG